MNTRFDVVIDQNRLAAELDALAAFSDTPFPAVTRVLWSEADVAARGFLRERCAEAGLRLREDALGNMFARWEGSDPSLAPVASGSHIDALPYAGRFDGTVGVLGPLEAMRALRRAGFTPRRSLELIVFTAEEPTRFGIGCFGSRALTGNLDPARLASLRDAEGRGLDELRGNAGYSGDLQSVRIDPGSYAAFVELHIEQGPILEREQIAIGVVRAIAAPASLRVRLTGEGGHAGAVLMPQRRDALLAGAEIALAVERAALATGSPDTVATTGVFTIAPGAVNSIPSAATLEIDVRDVAQTPRDAALDAIKQAVAEVCARRRIAYTVELLNADPPAACDEQLVNTVGLACAEAGVQPFRLMVSRAYHDSLFMARICPTTMIFIPCRDGVSHRPDEYASPEAIATGTAVLAHTLARLSSA
jgi:ureidoglycolate amidohydrolase